jgi:hypothetical protein
MAIEIDGLPINSMVIFHGYVTNNQMVGKSLRALVTFFQCADSHHPPTVCGLAHIPGIHSFMIGYVPTINIY